MSDEEVIKGQLANNPGATREDVTAGVKKLRQMIENGEQVPAIFIMDSHDLDFSHSEFEGHPAPMKVFGSSNIDVSDSTFMRGYTPETLKKFEEMDRKKKAELKK